MQSADTSPNLAKESPEPGQLSPPSDHLEAEKLLGALTADDEPEFDENYGEVAPGTTELDGFLRLEASFGSGKQRIRLTGRGVSLNKLVEMSK